MRKIQRAAKAAFTEDTELSAAMQVPLGGLGGLGAGGFLCRKALWRLLSRLLSLYREKTLFLCVFVLNYKLLIDFVDCWLSPPAERCFLIFNS